MKFLRRSYSSGLRRNFLDLVSDKGLDRNPGEYTYAKRTYSWIALVAAHVSRWIFSDKPDLYLHMTSFGSREVIPQSQGCNKDIFEGRDRRHCDLGLCTSIECLNAIL